MLEAARPGIVIREEILRSLMAVAEEIRQTSMLPLAGSRELQSCPEPATV
jgi:hypothetical protein